MSQVRVGGIVIEDGKIAMTGIPASVGPLDTNGERAPDTVVPDGGTTNSTMRLLVAMPVPPVT